MRALTEYLEIFLLLGFSLWTWSMWMPCHVFTYGVGLLVEVNALRSAMIQHFFWMIKPFVKSLPSKPLVDRLVWFIMLFQFVRRNCQQQDKINKHHFGFSHWTQWENSGRTWLEYRLEPSLLFMLEQFQAQIVCYI